MFYSTVMETDISVTGGVTMPRMRLAWRGRHASAPAGCLAGQ